MAGSKSRGEEEKAALELRVFLGFAEYAAREGLRVRPGSAVNRPYPEPDILCEVEGEGPIAFELARIVDRALAESTSVAIRKGVDAEAIWVGDETIATVRNKLGKTYVTPHPMELVVWADPSITPPSIWLPSYAQRLRALRGTSRFRRVWFVNLGGPDDERGVWFVDPPVGQSTLPAPA